MAEVAHRTDLPIRYVFTLAGQSKQSDARRRGPRRRYILSKSRLVEGRHAPLSPLGIRVNCKSCVRAANSWHGKGPELCAIGHGVYRLQLIGEGGSEVHLPPRLVLPQLFLLAATVSSFPLATQVAAEIVTRPLSLPKAFVGSLQ